MSEDETAAEMFDRMKPVFSWVRRFPAEEYAAIETSEEYRRRNMAKEDGWSR